MSCAFQPTESRITNHIFLFFCLLALPLWASGLGNEKDSLILLLNNDWADSQKMKVLDQVGLQLQMEDPLSGKDYYQELLVLAKRNASQNYERKALNGLGSCFYHLGNMDKAEEYWKILLNLLSSSNDSIGMGGTYSNLGMVYETRGNLNLALEAYDHAILMYRSQPNPVLSAIVNNNLGLVYQKQGAYAKANDFFLKALAEFEKAKHLHGISSVFTNLGMVSFVNKDYDQCIQFNKKAVEIKIKTSDKHGIATSYNNIGAAFEGLKNLDSSLYYHHLSLNLKAEIGDQLGLSASYNNIGIVYFKMARYEAAKEYQEKAYHLACELKNTSEAARSSADLGGILLRLKNFAAAKKYLDLALQLSTETGETENRLKVYHFLVEYYNNEGNPAANQFFEKYIALNDSLRNNEQLKEITQLQSKYEFEKEILALSHEQSEKLLTTQLNQQRLLRNISFGGFVLGLAFLILLSRGYRLLSEQKNTIQQSLEEREILLKEIHHRVKNNLQVVSSLLSLQSRTIQDPTALHAIEEGRNRVKAMALIHQNLYQEDKLIGVDLPVYIERLTENLLKTYTVDSQKIYLNRQIAPITIDVDTLVPLGLIINELISNALKYAFIGKQEGKIDIIIGQNPEGLKITVSDDGVGLPPEFNLEKTNSMGYKLIRSFVQKMKAKLDLIVHNGSHISILIPNLS